MAKYPEYKNLDLIAISSEILATWQRENTFEKSISFRNGSPSFTFYEGPPSANGMPGIHHVMARTIKDIFCRYQTMNGKQVKRKGGWDTHGLPIELSVEKNLGITKEDIGKKISVEEYNAACRREVMKYKDKWEELTLLMGYWVDMKNPYITFDNNYIESVWNLLKKLYDKKLLYKGYTIQPYSWAAGTGLSSHELNQPGCYKSIKDTSVTAQFKINKDAHSEKLFSGDSLDVFFLAWTTTPWTLPSNCALAVGKNIEYDLIRTFQPYTGKPIKIILAKERVGAYFHENSYGIPLDAYKSGDPVIPFNVEKTIPGIELAGINYEQLMPYVKPAGNAFRVITGDFVTTEDGTGVVHTASLFGADDFRVCNQNNISAIYVKRDSLDVPIVDKQGRFVEEVTDFAGMRVKTKDDQLHPSTSTDLAIALKLKKEGKAFRIEKYEHNYPHCWRTDEPVIYYPLDSWFVKTTACKERMLELNKTINWKPESTGTGRFGNWLENMVDWNLSRSRFWGIPLPVWRTDDSSEEICIGSMEELDKEIKKSVAKGFMSDESLKKSKWSDTGGKDLHRPYLDNVILVSPKGKKMYREPDLIDVWFDSGAMPYSQWHYPFENKELFEQNFPADFIAEGVDQTRGWFFTLHAIASMLFNSVAFKNVVSNGLVLDKHGNKMSKRLGNAVDPFAILARYGSDATRWYMISNAQPWDNLKFDEEGIAEVQRKFFRALYNSYSFFALYANIDGFSYEEKEIPVNERAELDQWVLSVLGSLVKRVGDGYNLYEPMRAARDIEEFVCNQLSNWYVRLSRRRFWKSSNSKDKTAAYQTLYTCLETVSKLVAPIAPFYAEKLFGDLNSVTGKEKTVSVHHCDFPGREFKNRGVNLAEHLCILMPTNINKELEEKMDLAQRICSLTLSLRKKVNIRVRQPLTKIVIPVLDEHFKRQVEAVSKIILAEVNVKMLEFITDTSGILVKKIKPNYKELGKKLGPLMKEAAQAISSFNPGQISEIETNGHYELTLSGSKVELLLTDVEIVSEDIPGWHLANDGALTVALDTSVTPELLDEGIARELVNRIQNLRKTRNFEVTDKINLKIKKNIAVESAIKNNFTYICAETLAASLEMVEVIDEKDAIDIEVADNISTSIFINKYN